LEIALLSDFCRCDEANAYKVIGPLVAQAASFLREWLVRSRVIDSLSRHSHHCSPSPFPKICAPDQAASKKPECSGGSRDQQPDCARDSARERPDRGCARHAPDEQL